MKAYPAYTDTSEIWLGNVPAHWAVKRLGSAFAERKEKVSDKDYPALSVTMGGIVPQIDTAAKTDDGDNRKLVRSGDFVINSRSDRKGSSGLSELDGSVSLISIVLKPAQEVWGKFAHWLLKSQNFQEEFYRWGTGIVADLWSTRYADMRSITLALPPLAEQQAIAAFLDRETAKIDGLIEEQRRLIALLAEKRQATISHAVTRGLNPSARLKPSGVDWLGDVPEGWEVVPLKYLVAFHSGSTPSKERPEFWEGEIPWASAKDLKTERLGDTQLHISEAAVADGGASLQPIGSVVVLVRGMTLAKAFPVCLLTGAMAINQDLKALRSGPRISGDFLAHALRGLAAESLSRIDEAGHGTKALRMDAWVSMEMPVPPISEQQMISDWIEAETTSLDALTKEAGAVITLLLERRAALISAAVTGKIDVREAQASSVQIRKSLSVSVLLGGVIIAALGRHASMGRMLVQKHLFMAEAHAGVSELQGRYDRQAAGPYDVDLQHRVEADLVAAGLLRVAQDGGPGSRVDYEFLGDAAVLRADLALALGDRMARFDDAFRQLADLSKPGIEAVATLYAAWNDFLMDGKSPSRGDLIREVLENWHPEKRKKFTKADLETWLNWMDRHEILPTGAGPKTQTGRLFP